MNKRKVPQVGAVYRFVEHHGSDSFRITADTWGKVEDVLDPGTAGVGLSGEKTVLVSVATPDGAARHLSLPLGVFNHLTAEVPDAR